MVSTFTVTLIGSNDFINSNQCTFFSFGVWLVVALDEFDNSDDSTDLVIYPIKKFYLKKWDIIQVNNFNLNVLNDQQ